MGLRIETWQTWAKRNNEKCREFSHWEGGHRYFRIRTRDRILIDHGFRCLPDTVTITTNRRDAHGKVIRISPQQAVRSEAGDYVDLYEVDDVEVVYFADTMDWGHFYVYRKLPSDKAQNVAEEG